MKRVIKQIGQCWPAALRHPKQMPKQAQGQDGFGPAGPGKKRKKGGPWGLIKSR
jgi:hypothetical protein